MSTKDQGTKNVVTTVGRIVSRTDTADYRTFDSWQEWVSAANAPTDMPNDERSSRDRSNDSWGGGSFALANDLARTGWPEGLGRVQRMAMAITDRIGQRIKRPIPATDVVGDSVDVPAFLAGVPDCMVTWDDSNDVGRVSPIVRIGLNYTVSAGISGETIFRRGAAVVALADALEQAGRRAEIDLILSAKGWSGGSVTYVVTIKRSSEHLQLDQLAYATCHVASFRRLGFSVMETAPKSVRHAVGIRNGHGYGRPTDPAKDVSQAYDLYLGHAYLGDAPWQSDAATQAWIIDQLRKQGVEVQ